MQSPTPWKTAAIVLALILAVVLICAALVLADISDFVLSLV
jgi:hypothetical protein